MAFVSIREISKNSSISGELRCTIYKNGTMSVSASVWRNYDLSDIQVDLDVRAFRIEAKKVAQRKSDESAKKTYGAATLINAIGIASKLNDHGKESFILEDGDDGFLYSAPVGK
ncbi:MAG: hypothetical protein ACRDCY_07905 [Aeromonas veronii]